MKLSCAYSLSPRKPTCNTAYVQSVFGIGGPYVGGQIFVLIAFCRDAVPRAAAEQLLSLVAQFKVKTARLVGEGRIFDG